MQKTRILNNGLKAITLNGQTLIISTFTEIITNYQDKTDFDSFDEYIEHLFLKTAFFAVRPVLIRKQCLTALPLYDDLLRDTYADYMRDKNADGYCSIMRELEKTREILAKEYAKTHDDGLKTMTERTTATIDSLNKKFTNDDTQGNGHDLIITAYLVLWEHFIKYGLMPYDEVAIKTKKGTRKITVKALASRAVDNYISNLNKSMTAMENNDNGDDNGDDDNEKQTALETIKYFENFDYRNLDDFYIEYDINDKYDRLICEYIVAGYSQKEIADMTATSDKTVRRHIAKIGAKIQTVTA